MLFGDQMYQQQRRTLLEKIKRSARRAWQNPGVPVRHQVGGVVGGIAAAGGALGYGARAIEDNFSTPQRLKHPRQVEISPPNKRLRGSGVEKPSFQNTPQTQQVQGETGVNMNGGGDGDGSGNAAGLRETPVDNVNPYEVYRGPPSYTFCSLPYRYDAVEAWSNHVGAATVFRMTSPYDCLVVRGLTDLNAGAGTANITRAQADSSDVTITKARWFDYYAGMYNYYHVVSARWRCIIENKTGEPFWVYWMYSNETNPPYQASNQDIQLWAGVKGKYVGTEYTSIQSTGEVDYGYLPKGSENNEATASTAADDQYQAGNNVTARGVKHVVGFGGEYRTGDFNREIRLDSQVENWTSVISNPLLSERLHIFVKPQNDGIQANDATISGDDIIYRIRFEIDYLVEFKELKTGLRYPVQRQPLTVSIGNNEFTATA